MSGCAGCDRRYCLSNRAVTYKHFPNAVLTSPSLQFCAVAKEIVVDVIFILAMVALYAVTHWLVWAIERLRSPE